MSFDIGQVFSTAFSMMKERFLAILALWAIFFALSIAGSTVFGLVTGGAALGAGAMAGGSGADPVALAGMGFGLIIMTIVFYIAYIVVAFAQQASMTAAATPVERVSIGEALGTGLRSGLTIAGAMVLFLIAYFLVGLVIALVFTLLAFLSEILALIAAIALIPAAVYLVCRLSLLVPVVAVEKVYNPINAINRTWQVTKGNVVGIFVVFLLSLLIALMLIGLPVLLIFGSMFSAFSDPANLANSMVAFTGAFLLFIPIFFVWQAFSVALNASLHAAVSKMDHEQVSDIFS